MALQKSSLVFKVRRNPPELLAPSSPTPRELKLLSDIDDQPGLRCHVRAVQIFRFHPSMAAKDPVHAIRQALAKTLVFYYPLAGRLREYCSPNGSKLMVDCTGEGVIFIEAEADAMIEQFGTNEFQPPFPCFDELLYNVPGSDGIINCPLVLAQVTRLKCGGLIFAIRINHAIVDGIGTAQFIKAIAEMVNGAPKPSTLPVWCRELLRARNPPRVTHVHREFEQLPLDDKSIFTSPHHASFFFGPNEISAMCRLLPHHLAQSASSFEVLTACLWRCRTISLQWQNPHQEVRLLCIVNARFQPCRLKTPLPDGFYGNAFVYPAAVTTVGKLRSRPLGYAVELVKKAKDEANEEYVQSVLDLMAIKGRVCFTRTGSFMVSDITKSESDEMDYGWGTALYTGLAEAGLAGIHDGVSFYFPYTNSKGERGRVVPICLPQEAMMSFKKQIDAILNHDDDEEYSSLMLISNL